MLFARYLTKNNAAYSNMVVGEVISYKGRAVAFEAKSTNEINRFDLKNIAQHQLDYLEKAEEMGAVSSL
ncbi:hypothetical protein IIS_05197 [Bacillus cereus VD131]|nr:hypothetical protein IIS_05197 [Bacillus cereus VD131]